MVNRDPVIGEMLADLDEPGAVRPVHPVCDQAYGGWACPPHRARFRNNLEANIHESVGDGHVMVWDCPLHGYEAASG